MPRASGAMPGCDRSGTPETAPRAGPRPGSRGLRRGINAALAWSLVAATGPRIGEAGPSDGHELPLVRAGAQGEFEHAEIRAAGLAVRRDHRGHGGALATCADIEFADAASVVHGSVRRHRGQALVVVHL